MGKDRHPAHRREERVQSRDATGVPKEVQWTNGEVAGERKQMAKEQDAYKHQETGKENVHLVGVPMPETAEGTVRAPQPLWFKSSLHLI